MAKIVQGWGPRMARPGRPARRKEFGPPIALYGEVPVAPGSSAQVDEDAISNTSGRPIEVREIRFTGAIANTGAVSRFLNVGGIVTVMLSVNDKPITAVPTPIWSICRTDRALNQIVEEPRSAVGYVLRLSRPLLLPAGARVKCRFDHSGLVNFSATVGICLAGRIVDAAENVVALPYVLYWASKFRGYSEVSSEASTDRALANTLKRPLQIDRIIARHATVSSGSPTSPNGALLAMGDGRGSASDFASIAPIEKMARLKLITSRNQKVIEDVPLWDAFATSGALEVPHVLPAGDFYRATVTTVAVPAALDPLPMTAILTYRHQVHLSLVGWREEVL